MIDLNRYYIAKTYDGVSGSYAGRPGFVPQAATGDSGKFLRADGSWAIIDTSNFYTNNNPSGFITGVNLSPYVTTGQTGAFYPRSNPSGFVTGVDLAALYPRSNPSGFITGVNLSTNITPGQTANCGLD
jgi:hypothetical protein